MSRGYDICWYWIVAVERLDNSYIVIEEGERWMMTT